VYPFGIPDPTDGYYAPTFYGRGATAETAFYDGVREIVLGRKQMNEYDALVREWNSTAGDQVKREYMDAMAAA
jgi:putative aldouronate transport system substrate-binding protein